jgi:hypothetical protein
LYENRDIEYRKPIITSPTLNYKKPITNSQKQTKIPISKISHSISSNKTLNLNNSTHPKPETLTDSTKNEIKTLTENLNSLNDRFERLEEKLNQLITNTTSKLSAIPEMPIFNNKQPTQTKDQSIQFIPLQSLPNNDNHQYTPTKTNLYLQQQLKEKEEEIAILKHDNLSLTQQLKDLNENQNALIEWMNQFEQYLQYENTQ